MRSILSMQHEKPITGERKGGIHPSIPQYEFCMKFFENNSDLREEFHWWISRNDGFISWDFLPGNRDITYLHPSQQYRRMLYSVRNALETSCLNCADINSRYLAERIVHLQSLKVLTDKIVLEGEKYIDERDTLTNRMKETFSKKKPTKRHKEVYQIWTEIRNAIVRSLEVLTNEMSHRERQKPHSSRTKLVAVQDDRINDAVCAIL